MQPPRSTSEAEPEVPLDHCSNSEPMGNPLKDRPLKTLIRKKHLTKLPMKTLTRK